MKNEDSRRSLFACLLCISVALCWCKWPARADYEGRMPGKGDNAKWREANPHFNQGVSHMRSGSYDKAIAEFKQAVELYPSDSDYYNNLGLAYKKKGEMAEAEGALRQSIKLNGNSWDSWSNLGSVLKHQGRAEEAVEAYRRALQLRPPAKTQQLIKQNIAALSGRSGAPGASHY